MHESSSSLPTGIGLLLQAVMPHLQDLEQHEQEARMAQFFAGWKRYQQASYKRIAAPLDLYWQKGELRIFKTSAEHQQVHERQINRKPVLLIPSMINRSDILDLMPDRSLVRYLTGQGRDVFLLDWGEPAKDPDMQDLERIVTECLQPVLLKLSSDELLHVVGYCMGGTLLAASLSVVQDRIASATFMATPWDFHAGDSAMKDRVLFWSPMAMDMMNQYGLLPPDWLQIVFTTLDPQQSFYKFSSFADMALDDPGFERFVAVENWLNNGVALPQETAKACIRDWYLHNKPGTGTWEIGGDVIDPSRFEKPAFVVWAERDKLVPPQSSKALSDLLPKAQKLSVESGHVGLISGRNAISDFWEKLALWLQQND